MKQLCISLSPLFQYLVVSLLLAVIPGCLGGQGGQLRPVHTETGSVTGYTFVEQAIADLFDSGSGASSANNSAPERSGPQRTITPPAGYAPLVNATVRLQGLARTTVTNAQGRYALTLYDTDNITSGKKVISVEKALGDQLFTITGEVEINPAVQTNSRISVSGTGLSDISVEIITEYGDDEALQDRIDKNIFGDDSDRINHRYFPVAPGYAWVYENTADKDDTREISVISGTGAPDISGLFINWFLDTIEVTIKLATDKSGNIRIVHSSDHENITPEAPGIFMPAFPFEEEDTFSPFGEAAASSVIAEISNSEIAVPADTFEGYILVTRGGTDQYFARNIGLVKFGCTSETWELRSASLDVNYPPTAEDLVIASANRWKAAFESRDISDTMAEYAGDFTSDLGQDTTEIKAMIQEEFFDDGTNIEIELSDPEFSDDQSASVTVSGSMTRAGNYSISLELDLIYEKTGSKWAIGGKSIKWLNSYRNDKSSLQVQFDPASLAEAYLVNIDDLTGNTVSFTRTDEDDYHYIRILEYPGEAAVKASTELSGNSYELEAADFDGFTENNVFLIIIGSKSSSTGIDGQFAEYHRYFKSAIN